MRCSRSDYKTKLLNNTETYEVKRMKKKIAAIVLCIAMAGVLTACSKEISNDNLTIKQYKGLEVAQVEVPKEVTDEYVENTMKSYRGVSLDTEGTAEDGDTVSLDYVGKIDGVEFDGGSAQGAELELGSGTYIGANGDYKGFEEQIVGHKPGEKFDITVKFPSDYQQPDYADKVAVFTVTLNGIYPEMTDEWVQEISEESETIEEFRKEIRKNIEEYNEEKVESQLRTEVMEALLAQVEVKELPEEEVEKEIAEIKEYYAGAAKQYQMELDEFLMTSMGMDEKMFNEKAKEAAETAVTRRIACELLAEKHRLEPTEKETKEMTEQYAKQSGYEDVESFKKDFGEDVIKETILQKKVADYLVDKCVQVEKTDADSAE